MVFRLVSKENHLKYAQTLSKNLLEPMPIQVLFSAIFSQKVASAFVDQSCRS